MNITIIICSVSILLITLLYVVYRRREGMVCGEVCAIYCSAIAYIDQLCEINSTILKSWHHYMLKKEAYGDKSYHAEKKMTEEIIFRKNEIEQLSQNNLRLTFQPSIMKSVMLHKHKLTTQEVQTATKITNNFANTLIGNLDFLIGLLNAETTITASWLFAENRMRAFQHEANSIYYGSLEGMCSFPSQSVSVFEQLRNRLQTFPTEIGLEKRKQDYLQLQEIEFMKAEELIKDTKKKIDEDGERVDILGDKILSRQIDVFFAGSKSLQTERDIYSNVITQLQTKWKDKQINITGYSYQNFEHEFVISGHQCTYNDFIRKYATIVIFVLNGNVGGKTKEEFDIAMTSFKIYHHPIIFVYSKTNDVYNEDVIHTRNRVNEESQYWQDYTDNNQLRLLIQNDLSERLQKEYEELVEYRRKIIG